MSEENLTVIHKFDSKLTNAGGMQIPKDQLKALFEKGFEEVSVVILGSSQAAVNASGYEDKLFEKIKERQALPDSVVLDFMHSKGKLSNTSFKERVKIE